jgi:hypothetical protein
MVDGVIVDNEILMVIMVTNVVNVFILINAIIVILGYTKC